MYSQGLKTREREHGSMARVTEVGDLDAPLIMLQEWGKIDAKTVTQIAEIQRALRLRSIIAKRGQP